MIDSNRKELNTKPAAAHSLSVVSEIYSRSREDIIKRVIEEKAE